MGDWCNSKDNLQGGQIQGKPSFGPEDQHPDWLLSLLLPYPSKPTMQQKMAWDDQPVPLGLVHVWGWSQAPRGRVGAC